MEVKTIDVRKITPSPHQPRERFDKEGLGNLASSIAHHGLLQPLIVRPTGDDTYQIIAGERRWRAAQLTSIKEVPAIVKDVDNAEQMAESLIENVQREDLSAIEKGRAAYQLFLLNDIEMEPKELAGKIHLLHDIESGHDKWPTGGRSRLEKISKICDDIGKSKRTIRTWLETISVSPEIQEAEAVKPTEERESSLTLARLSTIENKEDQEKVYAKIERDEMDGVEASKFISKWKKLEPEMREEIVRSDVKVDVEAPDLGFEEATPIAISRGKAQEARTKLQKIREETKETLAKPEVQERGKLRRNWQALSSILNQLGDVKCPICGADHSKLKFTCHDLDVEEAQEIARQKYQESIGGEN